jgi:hypothetical protein
MTSRPPRRFWGMVRLSYSSFAIHLCNATLLFLLVNIMTGLVFEIHDEHERHELPEALKSVTQRHGPSAMALLYPGWNEEAIMELYAELSRMSYKYDAFTQFAMRSIQGSYVSVSEDGFRLNGHPAPWPPESAAFNIFVFGGSTTFGTGLPDRETIPASLEAQVNQLPCSSRVRVYNFGRPHYVSMQERALFEQLMMSGTVPQVAIFVDGLNDALWWEATPVYTNVLSRMMDLANMPGAAWRSSAWAREFVASLPLTRLASLLRARLRTSPPGEPDSSVTSPARVKVPVKARVNRWIVNRRLIEAVANEFGVKALFVWQPVPSYNYDAGHHLYGDQLWQQGRAPEVAAREIKTLYELMSTRRDDVGGEGNFLWLADIQRAKQENLYVDFAHYTAAFTMDIAFAIADDLGRRGWIPCVVRKRG